MFRLGNYQGRNTDLIKMRNVPFPSSAFTTNVGQFCGVLDALTIPPKSLYKVGEECVREVDRVRRGLSSDVERVSSLSILAKGALYKRAVPYLASIVKEGLACCALANSAGGMGEFDPCSSWKVGDPISAGFEPASMRLLREISAFSDSSEQTVVVTCLKLRAIFLVCAERVVKKLRAENSLEAHLQEQLMRELPGRVYTSLESFYQGGFEAATLLPADLHRLAFYGLLQKFRCVDPQMVLRVANQSQEISERLMTQSFDVFQCFREYYTKPIGPSGVWNLRHIHFKLTDHKLDDPNLQVDFKHPPFPLIFVEDTELNAACAGRQSSGLLTKQVQNVLERFLYPNLGQMAPSALLDIARTGDTSDTELMPFYRQFRESNA